MQAPTPPPTVTPIVTSRPTPEPSPDPTATPAADELLLVTAFDDDGLVLVDPDDGELARIAVGTAPWGVALALDRLAYAATAEGVAVVHVAREAVTVVPYATQSLPDQPARGEYRRGGLGIAVSPDGRRAHVGVSRFPGAGAIDVIDLETREVMASIPAGIRQFDVVVSADGTEVYAINPDSIDVTVIDAASFETRTLAAAPLGNAGGLASWNEPHYAAL